MAIHQSRLTLKFFCVCNEGTLGAVEPAADLVSSSSSSPLLTATYRHPILSCAIQGKIVFRSEWDQTNPFHGKTNRFWHRIPINLEGYENYVCSFMGLLQLIFFRSFVALYANNKRYRMERKKQAFNSPHHHAI